MGEKYLRLDSKFISVAAFWRPDRRDEVTTGTLTVDEEEIRFVTSPQYFRGAQVSPLYPTQWDSDSALRSNVLHGFFEGKSCTLLGLVEVERPGLISGGNEAQAVVSTAYHAAVLVSGMLTGAIVDRCLESARYTFSSLSKFVNASPLEKWGDRGITIDLQTEPEILLDCSVLETHVRIELKAYYTLTTDEEREARQIKTITAVKVTPPDAQSLSWFMDIGNRLENLFSLLAGTSLVMETFFIYQGDNAGAVIRKRHAYGEKYSLHDSVRHSNSQLAHAISIWLSESEGFREIENLLLGVLRRGRLFIETEFLSLAQALEGFHRATEEGQSQMDKASFRELRTQIEKFLESQKIDDETAKKVNAAVAHCNETSFRSRLKSLCSRISQSTLGRMKIDSEAFAASVVNTRNMLTHAGGLRYEKVQRLTGGEIFLLNQKMRALLRGVFLLHLGFPESQFMDLIVREATKWG